MIGPMAAAVSTEANEAPLWRIDHGDCLAFLQSLPAASVDLVVTDPAYSGMNRHLMLGRGRIVGRYSDAGRPGGRWFQEFQDDPETFRALLRELHRVLRDDRHVYVMFDSYSLLSLGHLVREVFDVKNLLVWDKALLGMGHYYRRRHELIVFASKGKRPLSRRDLPDIVRVPRITTAAYATQKPVALFETLVRASAEPGFVVCDPFVGSGSTAVAALRAGCGFRGCDASEEAVALARERVASIAGGGPDPLEGPYRVKRRRTAETNSSTSGVPSAAADAR